MMVRVRVSTCAHDVQETHRLTEIVKGAGGGVEPRCVRLRETRVDGELRGVGAAAEAPAEELHADDSKEDLREGRQGVEEMGRMRA